MRFIVLILTTVVITLLLIYLQFDNFELKDRGTIGIGKDFYNVELLSSQYEMRAKNDGIKIIYSSGDYILDINNCRIEDYSDLPTFGFYNDSLFIILHGSRSIESGISYFLLPDYTKMDLFLKGNQLKVFEKIFIGNIILAELENEDIVVFFKDGTKKQFSIHDYLNKH